MSKASRQYDQARTLALLWGSHTRPGRSGLTLAAIIEAAVTIADAEGLHAVSMRRVAERLQVGAMSLYTHVWSKRELTDLMVDTVAGELYADVDEPGRQPGGWRGALQFIARRNWELFDRHPWLLQLSQARPVMGPHVSRNYEAELRPLDGIGLSDIEMDDTLALVLSHVSSTARTRLLQRSDQAESGQSDLEWWVTTAPLLEAAMSGQHFPVAARVGQAAGVAHQAVTDPDHALAFGLARILDGVEALIASRQSAGGA
ncbi:MAG: TetR/AcrR family transcriptional regulator C-terminal domain-containing protein [Thermomicrobiales bacterium]|nr:TetR/AcrR family transcriptional regulator C-terminal domain-containing protein [Thermomicrobiales bacterium]